jgi:hypothetical protein
MILFYQDTMSNRSNGSDEDKYDIKTNDQSASSVSIIYRRNMKIKINGRGVDPYDQRL